MLSWSLYSGFFASLTGEGIRYISWPMLVMTTVVMVYGGGPLFRRAWWGVRAGAPGMEALVCLGAGAAYLFSLYNFGRISWHLYFDTASMLITLVLLGKLLEAKAKVRVRRDLEGFLNLQPNKVRLCTERFPRGRFAALAQLAPGDDQYVQRAVRKAVGSPTGTDCLAGIGDSRKDFEFEKERKTIRYHKKTGISAVKG